MRTLPVFPVLLLFWDPALLKDWILQRCYHEESVRCVCFSSVKFTTALLLHFKISQISSLFHSVLVYFFLVFKEVGFTLSSFRRCLVIDIIPTAICFWMLCGSVIQSPLKSWVPDRFPLTTNGIWIWSEMTWKVKQLIFFFFLSAYFLFEIWFFATVNT